MEGFKITVRTRDDAEPEAPGSQCSSCDLFAAPPPPAGRRPAPDDERTLSPLSD